MRKLIFSLIACCCSLILAAQPGKADYDKAMAKATAGELEEAVTLFSKCISVNPEEYLFWFNRGVARSQLSLFEDALVDFEQTIKLNPAFKNAYLNRGIARKRLTDYEGAIADYTYCIRNDKNYGEAYYNRALVYELLGKKNLACADFKKAFSLRIVQANTKAQQCSHPSTDTTVIHPLLRLTKTAPTGQYGFTAENPVKVGIGPAGGPDNIRSYIEFLRDAKGKPLKYKRVGSCCPFQTALGTFSLDRFELIYLDKTGAKKKTILYITFNDYAEPMILQGFKTVRKK